MVAELHALLQAAGVPGPYVLAGHSMGGFFARLYASTYPDEVVGLVLVDAYSELLEAMFAPEQWPALVRLNPGSHGRADSGLRRCRDDSYGSDDAPCASAAASPLRPMPLAVLAHGKPFALPEDPALSQGFTPGELEPFLLAANEAQAALVPTRASSWPTRAATTSTRINRSWSPKRSGRWSPACAPGHLV